MTPPLAGEERQARRIGEELHRRNNPLAVVDPVGSQGLGDRGRQRGFSLAPTMRVTGLPSLEHRMRGWGWEITCDSRAVAGLAVDVGLATRSLLASPRRSLSGTGATILHGPRTRRPEVHQHRGGAVQDIGGRRNHR